jgi:hypothetical protein
MMAVLMVVGYFAGLPTASARVAPMFAVPVIFLASTRRHICATGYVLLSLGCFMRGLSSFWVPGFTPGQVVTAVAAWGWMSWNFGVMATMVMSRGIRR